MRGRLVTIALLVIMVVAVNNTIEAWPVTSFRLFSAVRTGTTVSTQLYLVDGTGQERLVEADDQHAFSRRTLHQLSTLTRQPPSVQRAKIESWLTSAGIDQSSAATAIVRRRTLAHDLHGGLARVTSTRDLLTVHLK